MYYSTVVIIPEILTRDNIVINPQIEFINNHFLNTTKSKNNTSFPIDFLLENNKNQHHTVTLIILGTALYAHAGLGFYLYRMWKNGLGVREKIIYNFFNFYNTISNGIIRIGWLFGFSNSNGNKTRLLEPHNNDLIIIVCIGYLLIIIGTIDSIIYYLWFIWFKDETTDGLFLIIFTAVATFIANLGWAIVPSMLASRFPTHFRITGSSLAYNGGLAISFASPFIIMEFYLIIKSEYIIFIAMMLGAASMIIGAKRLLHHDG